MENYGVAKGFLSFLIWIGFGIVALAIVVTLYAWDQELGFFPGFLVGLGIALVGLLNVAVAQMGMAQIAAAESSAAIYWLLAKKEGLATPAAGLSAVRPDVAAVRLDVAAAGKTIKTFKGYAIVREVEGVSVNGNKLSGVIEAERWINSEIATKA
jgi:hypothetical protein